MLWKQRRNLPGNFSHHPIGDSLCRLVTPHQQVTQVIYLGMCCFRCLRLPLPGLICTELRWRYFLESLTVCAAGLMNICWQLSSHCLVKIPFIWMKPSSDNKQQEEIRGSSGVNTRPNYYSSSWREKTSGCSPDGKVAHARAVALCWSQTVGIT